MDEVQLNEMEARLDPEGKDFAKTHPSPKSRIKDVQKSIGKYAELSEPATRQARPSRAMGAR